MVLYKRKPVQIPAPDPRAGHARYTIEQTGETFSNYDAYSSRLDFYNQPKFICQITGQSKLTFFDALESEQAGAKEVQEAFPESLKGPVLRKVQFQTISRIDHLVDNIYDEFKSEFFPGEQVMASIVDNERIQGTIREKIRVGPKPQDDGSMSQPFSRYVITCDDKDGQEVVVDGPAVYRDRKIFTKAVLRTFIKNAVTREAWNGAPWIVKPEFAESFSIDTRVPQHLKYDHKLQERKQQQAAKRTTQSLDSNRLADVSIVSHSQRPIDQEPIRLPDLKPKSQKLRPQVVANPMNFNLHPSYEPTYVSIPPSPGYMSISLRNNNPPPLRKQQSPPPPPPPKYPIDDLEVGPRAGVARPKLKFMCNDPPTSVPDPQSHYAAHIKMESIGPLLETWDTLNVYCEIFKLDSFTFDDYVEALCVTSLNLMPQLVEEIHCSVLKVLISAESDGGRIEFTLPAEEEEEEEDEATEKAEDGDSTMGSPQPEKPSGRATRSSIAKIEAERAAAEETQIEKASKPEYVSRIDELLEDYDWIDSLRKRQFQAGGWQRIIAGLLHTLSRNERKKKECEMILAELVPINAEATQETVMEHYALLDVNHKVRITQMLCMLTTETKAIRGYMDDCSETMTQYRKEKIEWQRQRKQAIEDLKGLNDQRKLLAPDNLPTETPLEADDSKLTDVENSQVEEDTDSEIGGRRSRRAGKKEEKPEKKSTPVPKAPKQSKQWIKLLKDIQKKEEFIKECEKEIAVIDNDLREADCPRTRVLGKDRFWNRYYWFERNGMPYGGLPDSSTASAAYANGCIWVQGPDDLEREGYIDLPIDLQNEYKAKFNMTVSERKEREEGSTSVFNSRQWGFISEPSDLDDLIRYLDPRGVNELKLRKELVAYHDKIVMNMKNRKAYLGLPEDVPEVNSANKEGGEREEKKDEAVAGGSEAAKAESETPDSSSPAPDDRRGKRNTRSKRSSQPPAILEAEAEAAAAKAKEEEEERKRNTSPRCLAWENSVALEELGHLHCEPPPPPRRKNNNKKRESAVMTEVEEPPRKTRRR